MKILTAEYDDYIIAYADHINPDEEVMVFLEEIYCFYHGQKLPMYAFFSGLTVVLDSKTNILKEKPDVNLETIDLYALGTFSRSNKPDQLPKEIMAFKFDITDPEDVESCAMQVKFYKNPEEAKFVNLRNRNNLYFSDGYMIVTPHYAYIFE